MKKWLCFGLTVVWMIMLAAAGLGETLFVDNRETDKVYPERLNLRAEPSKNGGIIGLYYTGAQVETTGEMKDGYAQVEIGGVSGYMAGEYLITEQEAQARYGTSVGFGEGRAAEIDLAGMWMGKVPLYAQADATGEKTAELENGTVVGLLGILDTWAYIRTDVNGVRRTGYVPLDVLTDVGERKVSIVSSGKADVKTKLYDAPTKKAKEIMVLSNGTACFNLFGRKEGEWRRVRVGGISGWIRYTQADHLHDLGTKARNAIPYYPLLMQTKEDALLYQTAEDQHARFMTLGRGMKVELLGETEKYVYVRTYENGAGVYDCGDFGFVQLNVLSLAEADEQIGVAQVDDGDLPAILYDSQDAAALAVGALCSGAQVSIVDFTQSDRVKVALGGKTAFMEKAEIRMLTSPEDPLSDRIPQRAPVKQEAVLRKMPDAKSETTVSVPVGERVYVLGKMGAWLYVKAGDSPSIDVTGKSQADAGFVLASELNAPASVTHLVARVNKDKINLRDEASSEGEIIGRVRTDDVLRVADYGTKWTCVVLADGKRGYVMTSYLDFE